MLPDLRDRHPLAADVVDQIRDYIGQVTEEPITFPLSRTPVFISREVAAALVRDIQAYFELMGTPGYQSEAACWIPEVYRAGDPLAQLPALSCFDFAIATLPDGSVAPRLLECQGFSSLYGVIPWWGELLTTVGGLEGFTPFLSHGSWSDYLDHLKQVAGDSDLIDVDTARQTFRTDFWVLRHFAGISVHDLTDGYVDRINGQRIFNRTVPLEAELAQMGGTLARYFTGGERNWVVPPGWFWGCSKRALPHYSRVGQLVPRTELLTAESLGDWADDGREVVLKPIDGFGGKGVNLAPTAEDMVAALGDGRTWILQDRVHLAPTVLVPTGKRLHLEIRVLCLGRTPAFVLGRLAETEMLNVGYNKANPWCGMTVGLFPRT
ncbi:MAG: hypothetical protein COW24_05315 [Candidatus Kerfeldbacteria bacterium CG15_BIG_FIL_POST_REV_8_21_14_020_45_12]|uniref:Glutathionylspermidine synthase pre-ATP-grasp-like domain-containing protein n=1 Tax=Candidatus Kerfeldbacteria bacterium CG15_BIG_FIL_POST_REV_8_21_14_020_45_12 TaxID=2014247 RepID=A0A2M7H2M9_9BACT|nr:MAG: hypothetical protein COW24_05315 [Candidatus Kerfeldbacteria bacterium CG15_BIG_FIL_POST_REV_8_21_14_020_45_12]PJA93482.1 MAG: hypothetical protein CO132_02530 [Candidatus Kerfeldbacteria bacterium CG_4_9_14_3_um_filter_45_8]